MKNIVKFSSILALVIFAVNANPLVKKHPECEFGDLERKCQNVCVDVTELKTEYKEVEDCVKHEICQEVDNCRLVDKCSVEKIPFKVKVTKPKCELKCEEKCTFFRERPAPGPINPYDCKPGESAEQCNLRRYNYLYEKRPENPTAWKELENLAEDISEVEEDLDNFFKKLTPALRRHTRRRKLRKNRKGSRRNNSKVRSRRPNKSSRSRSVSAGHYITSSTPSPKKWRMPTYEEYQTKLGVDWDRLYSSIHYHPAPDELTADFSPDE